MATGKHAHHDHDHGHDHDHAHAHAPGQPHIHGSGSKRALMRALILTSTLTVVEVIGGYFTGSLALLADAGHMLSDTFSLGLALFGVWLAAKPPTPQRTFGYKRAEILTALFNGITLVVISILIFIEAYERFRDPPQVLGKWMLLVATLGLLVNLGSAALLWRSERESLNLQAALRHVLADLLGSVGAVSAALIILFTGWHYADPLISVLIAFLILGSSWSVIRESTNVLLEAAPTGINVEEVGIKMAQHPGVMEVHDLHVWTITSGFPALSAHVLVHSVEGQFAIRRALEQMLEADYGITHTTLQMDQAKTEQELLQIQRHADPRRWTHRNPPSP